MLISSASSKKTKSINHVLGESKYILAPMVDQSELAWRILARKYGAQLCFTPMFNANVILKDLTYRKKVLKDLSCEEDRPLIVQFCANTPEQLLEAAKIVQPFCDAIDLNLGCPQHIARRGHFGAFLQDSWELLHKMIYAANDVLDIPVTAKIRIFPEVEKTVAYAKMLESAGCSMLSVHGRTIEQKGIMTGLADWNQVKEVKKNLQIPVISNGNIQNLEDIHQCIEQTGVDGVMVAESHLSNPCIFIGENPSVYKMTKEYLALVRIHQCPISFVRSHLFKLWVHTLKVYPDFQLALGRAQNLDDMENINDEINQACQEDDEACPITVNGFPHYVCQPYVRTRKHKEEQDESENKTERELSRNQQRRLLRYQRKVETLKFKRKSERERRKEKRAVEKLNDLTLESCPSPRTHSTSKLAKSLINCRLKEAMQCIDSLKVCVDLSWTNSMNNKEVSKLAGQIGRLYGSNRKASSPASLYFTGFSSDSHLYQECTRKHNGFENYKITVTENSFLSLFDKENLIYLSPDAEIELDAVDASHIYILGGLVDETVRKQLTNDRASEIRISCRRLPIHTYMHRSGHHHSYSTVLAINQVFDILLSYYCTKNWREALMKGMPPRKGFLINEDVS
ncbi:tRNA-dihydrouridine(16/17) synthase [NAD(P)(+)]-like [Styela clava]